MEKRPSNKRERYSRVVLEIDRKEIAKSELKRSWKGDGKKVKRSGKRESRKKRKIKEIWKKR